MIKEVINKLYGVIIKPEQTISKILNDGYIKRHSSFSILIYALSTYIPAVFYLFFNPNHNLFNNKFSFISIFIVIFLFFATYFIAYLKIYIDTLIVKSISKNLNGNDNFYEYFNVYSFIWIPHLLFILITILYVYKIEYLNIDIIRNILRVIIFIWYFILSVIGLKKLNNFTNLTAGLISLSLLIPIIFAEILRVFTTFLKELIK